MYRVSDPPPPEHNLMFRFTDGKTLSKPPVLSPKPTSEQLVKRFSFNRAKPNETSLPTAPPRPDETAKRPSTNGSDNAAPVFLKPAVTSTPVSGSSLVRRISAEYNSKALADDKSTFASRPKPWAVTSPSSETKKPDIKVVKSASENSFKDSNFVASLLSSSEQNEKASEHAFKLGSVDKSEGTRRFPESVASRVDDSASMKSLFASLEPSECKRIEEEFEKLTNESAVDNIQDADATLEEILSQDVARVEKKKVSCARQKCF